MGDSVVVADSQRDKDIDASWTVRPESRSRPRALPAPSWIRVMPIWISAWTNYTVRSGLRLSHYTGYLVCLEATRTPRAPALVVGAR